MALVTATATPCDAVLTPLMGRSSILLQERELGMSENRPLMNRDSLQTVVAVCFVLALLSVTFNFYNFNRLNNHQRFMAELNNHNIAGMQSQLTSLSQGLEAANKRSQDLKKELDEQKKLAATQTAN
jgi:hypothetical protein